MKRIKAIYFIYLRNEAHYEFLWIFSHLLDEYPQVKALLATLYDTFIALLGIEKKLLDAARASALTQQIVDADRRVDHAISSIKATIKAARYSLDPTVVEAARILYIRIREFGDIRKKAYEEESAAVQVLLGDLNGIYAPQVLLTGIQAFVMELADAEAAFIQLYLQRGDETALRPQERMTDVHREIEATYHSIITLINASAILSPGSYDDFIAKLNAQVIYFNEHNHHHARKDISVSDDCVVEPVDTQKYSEKAITPIPKAYYREEGKPTVELVFAKDFSVTYKNNVNVGTADLTLHGKGKYRGQKTITFNIAR
ncbi:MAG: DUF6261 family protein [Dysgonamonadaceae bacterium]|nr:DUF6261 family protein [Dysgonamonadaceae bacterium]